jgi:ABC-2 type transport system ATP-binding protein
LKGGEVTEAAHQQGAATQSGSPAIEVEGLSKRYGELEAVCDLSFRIGAGEVVGFLGPNGAGKTTTMRMLTGFIPPSDGTIRIAGADIISEGLAARRALGYLPETPPLYPEMTPAGYIDFVARIKDVPRSRRKASVERALSRCGLLDVSHREIRQLSKGYRQRVGLAQAIVHEPKVLVLDEPTVGLDPIQVREIRALIRDLAATGGQTILLSTHILAEVEAICQRAILLHHGRKVLDQPISEMVSGGASLEEVFARVMSREAGDEIGRAADSAVGAVGAVGNEGAA